MASEAYLAFEQADEAVALHAGAELERQGWRVARASAELYAEENRTALIQAISQASVFVLVASPAAAESAALKRDVAIALNNGRALVVVRAADIPAGSWIESTLDLNHAIDMRAGVNAEPETLSALSQAARGARGQGTVLAMLNIKGGVGKTVLAANLFAAAHLADKRSISFIDLDPQHNLTQYFLSPGERHRVRDRNHTLYGVLNPRGDHALSAADLGPSPYRSTGPSRAKAKRRTSSWSRATSACLSSRSTRVRTATRLRPSCVSARSWRPCASAPTRW